jgi:serine/threonine-protein kinase
MSDTELSRRAQGRLGTILSGKYRLDSVLGVGGMAVVFAATHRNQKRVAIKMLHPELSANEELRARFLREGYAANTVDHPGAVAVLDDDTAEDGAAYLVMERLEGEEVDRLWGQWRRHLPPQLVLALASQLLDVLSAAHGKAIVHRDIKPSNLYVTRDGTVKVLDFGIARVRDAASSGSSATSTGMMLGTPAFMAPEQALGKSSQIDGTTDVWSVGATLFTLLSGSYVHEGESATEVIVLVATQPARSLASVAPHIDPRIVQLVDRALAFHKADRWASAAAMRDAVHDAYVAVFGTRLTKEPLEKLFAAVPPEMAATSHALAGAAPTPAPLPAAYSPPPGTPAWPSPAATPGSMERGAPFPPTRPMTAMPAQAAPPHFGGSAGGPSSMPATTAQPVSSERYDRPAGLPSKTSSAIVVAGLALLGVALVAGVVVVATGRSSGPAAPGGSAVEATVSAPPAPLHRSPLTPATSPSAAAPSAPLPPLLQPASSSSPIPPSPATPKPPVASAPAPVPSARPLPLGGIVDPSRRAPTLPPPAPAAPAGKPAYCATSPTTIDRQGFRVPRPECE